MTPWQKIEKKTQETKRHMKKCETAKRQIAFDFPVPKINGVGQCSGCYYPDDEEMQETCKRCQYNEFFIEEVRD